MDAFSHECAHEGMKRASDGGLELFERRGSRAALGRHESGGCPLLAILKKQEALIIPAPR